MSIPVSLTCAVTADELRKWPLMHGTPATGEQLDAIRREGLVARDKGLNSFPYDEELGRTTYVFLAPLSFRGNYGFGAFILVDPVILLTDGIRFADEDISNTIDCIKTAIRGHTFVSRKVKDAIALRQIISAEDTRGEAASYDERTMRIVASPAFKAYYDRFHSTDEKAFFRLIEKTAEGSRLTLFDYFGRTGSWPLSEEILIPDRIGPENLLGQWDGARWTQWGQAKSEETTQRVEQFITALKQWRR